MRSCGTCDNYSALNQECRKDPPQIILVGNNQGTMMCPKVPPHYWCGHHKKRKERRPEDVNPPKGYQNNKATPSDSGNGQ